MSAYKPMRMVRCVLCNRSIVEHRAVRAAVGRNGTVPVWLCKPCSEKAQ